MENTRANRPARPAMTWLLVAALGTGAALGLTACNRQTGTSPATGEGQTGPSGAGTGSGTSSTLPSSSESGAASGTASMPSTPSPSSMASSPSGGATGALPGTSPASAPR